jgi:hypothetical protein
VLNPLAMEIDDSRMELSDWSRADDTKTIDAYQAFLDRWPDGRFKDLAVLAIFNLGGQPRLAARRVPISAAPTLPGGNTHPVTPPVGGSQEPAPAPGPQAPLVGGLGTPTIDENDTPRAGGSPNALPGPTIDDPVHTGSALASSRPGLPESTAIAAGDRGRFINPPSETKPVEVRPLPAPVPVGGGAALVDPNARIGNQPISTGTGAGQCMLTAAEIQREINLGNRPCGMVQEDSAAVVDKAQLPDIPGPPVFSDAGYPACREEFQIFTTNRSKITKIDECLNRLRTYTTTTLLGFVENINQHQKALDDLFRATMPGEEAKYTFIPETQKKFHVDIMAEFDASGEGGPHRALYEATDRRVKADRAYLEGQRQTFVERSATAE